jgi:hypothetical protein
MPNALDRVNKTQFSILVIFQPKTKIFPQNLVSNISMLKSIQDNNRKITNIEHDVLFTQ